MIGEESPSVSPSALVEESTQNIIKKVTNIIVNSTCIYGEALHSRLLRLEHDDDDDDDDDA